MMTAADQVVLEIIEVIRRNLPTSTKVKSGPLTAEQMAVLRPVILKVVGASVFSTTGGDLATAVADIAEAIVRLIAKDSSILSSDAGTTVHVQGVESGAISGQASITFSGLATLTSNASIGFDAGGAAREGVFQSPQFKQALLIAMIVSVLDTAGGAGANYLYEQMNHQVVAASVVVTGDDVRIRVEPSLNATIVGHLNKGTRGIQSGEEGAWRYIITDSGSGWVHGDYVVLVK